MSEQEDIEQRLSRLAGATDALRPSRGFSARVMLALASDVQAAPSFLEATWFSARRLLPVAAIAAAMAVVWAVQVDGSVDDELATSYASVELE
ncbi:MAG TPA: hypothetical protein VFK05_18940 [Polyangiaceae bacterium]|nr:hypothetical protein [Polyangiaceae bacterium]